jgi:hypothetical protein
MRCESSCRRSTPTCTPIERMSTPLRFPTRFTTIGDGCVSFNNSNILCCDEECDTTLLLDRRQTKQPTPRRQPTLQAPPIDQTTNSTQLLRKRKKFINTHTHTSNELVYQIEIDVVDLALRRMRRVLRRCDDCRLARACLQLNAAIAIRTAKHTQFVLVLPFPMPFGNYFKCNTNENRLKL